MTDSVNQPISNQPAVQDSKHDKQYVTVAKNFGKAIVSMVKAPFKKDDDAVDTDHAAGWVAIAGVTGAAVARLLTQRGTRKTLETEGKVRSFFGGKRAVSVTVLQDGTADFNVEKRGVEATIEVLPQGDVITDKMGNPIGGR